VSPARPYTGGLQFRRVGNRLQVTGILGAVFREQLERLLDPGHPRFPQILAEIDLDKTYTMEWIYPNDDHTT